MKGTTPHSTPSQSDQSKPCKKGLSLTHFADEKTEAQNKMGKLPKITWLAAPGIRTEAQSLSFQDRQCSWEGKKNAEEKVGEMAPQIKDLPDSAGSRS